MRTLNGQFIEMMKTAVPEEGRNAETDKAIRFYFFAGAAAVNAILLEAREAARQEGGSKADGTQLVRRMQQELEEYRHEMHLHMAKALRKSIETGLIAIFGLDQDDEDKHDR